MNKHTLEEYIKQGYSQYKIAKIEGCSQTKVSRWLRTFGLITKRIPELLYCSNCKKMLGKNETKFCSNKCQGEFRKKQFVTDVQNGKIKINPEGQQLRKYILRTRKHNCICCGLSQWQGKDIPLIVDHIDGNYRNISNHNIQLLCPNCDAQLSTYKGKNRGKGRYKRRERYSKGQSY